MSSEKEQSVGETMAQQLANPHRATPRRSRSWPCGTAQRSWNEELRNIIDKNGLKALPEVRSTLWVAQPEHPEFTLKALGDLPSPETYFLQPIGFWLPDQIWGVRPFCPDCRGNSSVEARGWVTAPRRVLGLHSHWYLDTRRYYCGGCKKTFCATDPGSIESMPPWIQARFGVLITRRCAIDDTLTRFIVDQFNALSVSAITVRINQWHHETFYLRMRDYWWVPVLHCVPARHDHRLCARADFQVRRCASLRHQAGSHKPCLGYSKTYTPAQGPELGPGLPLARRRGARCQPRAVDSSYRISSSAAGGSASGVPQRLRGFTSSTLPSCRYTQR